MNQSQEPTYTQTIENVICDTGFPKNQGMLVGQMPGYVGCLIPGTRSNHDFSCKADAASSLKWLHTP